MCMFMCIYVYVNRERERERAREREREGERERDSDGAVFNDSCGPRGTGTPVPLQVRRGSKYQIFEASGSKNHTLNSIWGRRPQILGTWTLWGRVSIDSVVSHTPGTD